MGEVESLCMEVLWTEVLFAVGLLSLSLVNVVDPVEGDEGMNTVPRSSGDDWSFNDLDNLFFRAALLMAMLAACSATRGFQLIIKKQINMINVVWCLVF